MSLYGGGLYGGGRYSGASPAPGSTGAFFDLSIGVRVFIYDRNGNYRGMLQSGACPMVAVNFRHGAGGCADFSLEFADYVSINKSDRVKIRLFNDETDFFTGVVRVVPIEGSTSHSYIYSGFGMNDYLVRMNAEALSYSSKTLTYIAHDLLDSIITVKSNIMGDYARIVLPDITVTSFVTNYAQVDKVLDALRDIANSTGEEYLYGVGRDGYFFFMPRSEVLQATLVVGARGIYGIESYEPADEQEQRTRLYVLKKDGTFWTELVSAEDNDIYEEKVTGPDIADADLTLWATGKLLESARILRSASVDWAIKETPIPCIVADGFVRVLSNRPPTDATMTLSLWGDDAWGDGIWGGEAYTGFFIDDTLALKGIEYAITVQGATRKLALGAPPLRIEDILAGINKKLTSLEVSLGV